MIPGLPLGTPDHSYCLFHQKLQMINCCIERKLAREQRETGGKKEAEGKVSFYTILI
jgi:Rab3 GTPase-activating protein catalytic subunit